MIASPCVGLALVAGNVSAQQFPTKPVRVINPAAPGGNSDIFFRLLSPKMGEILGQQLFIDYRPGAGGTVGADIIAKSPPDGYTTGIVAGSFMINPSLMRKLPYDTVKDFTPLGLHRGRADRRGRASLSAGEEHEGIDRAREGAARRSSTIRVRVRARSGTCRASSSIRSRRSRSCTFPTKASLPASSISIAGHVQISFASMPVVLGHVRQGRLRLLAQAGAKRATSLPDVPTMEEAGVPGFVVSSGFSLVGPAGIPRPIAEKLNDALAKALRDPANRKALIDQGAEPVGNTIEEHAAIIRSEIEKWRKVIKDAGIEPQ